MSNNAAPRKAHHPLTLTVPAVPHNAHDATETEIGANSGSEAISLWMRYASEFNGPGARLTPDQARTLAADLTARADEIEPPARADHPEPGCADCGHRSDCATHDEPAMPAGRCNCGKVTRRTDDQMEALHEQARAYARSAAGDAFDGIPSLIELDSVLSMLSDAYMSGWSERDGRGEDLTPEQIAGKLTADWRGQRDHIVFTEASLIGAFSEAVRIARGEVSL